MDERLIPPGIDDARTRRLLALMDRWDDLPIETILVWRLDTASEDLLRQLAWGFHIMGLEGWDLAVSEAEQRELVRRALQLHRYRGTPWSIRFGLDAINLGDLDIVEARTAAAQLDEAGIFAAKGPAELAADWFDHWAEYGLIIRPDLGVALDRQRQDLVRAMCELHAPARSQLVRVIYQYSAETELGFGLAGNAGRSSEVSGTARGRRSVDATLGLTAAGVRPGHRAEGAGRGRHGLATAMAVGGGLATGRVIARRGAADGRSRTNARLGLGAATDTGRWVARRGRAVGPRRLTGEQGVGGAMDGAGGRDARGHAGGGRRLSADVPIGLAGEGHPVAMARGSAGGTRALIADHAVAATDGPGGRAVRGAAGGRGYLGAPMPAALAATLTEVRHTQGT